MVNIEYLIENEFKCYSPYNNITKISIGGMGYNNLKECKQDKFICDCLTHEFIHALLEHIFNTTASQLFEFIGDSLLDTQILKKGVCLTCSDKLWCDMIEIEGVKYIYNEYMLDDIDLIQCYLICNRRLKNDG